VRNPPRAASMAVTLWRGRESPALRREHRRDKGPGPVDRIGGSRPSRPPTRSEHDRGRFSRFPPVQRAFDLDVLACPRCGGRLRLIATVEDPEAIRAILAALAGPREMAGCSSGPALCSGRKSGDTFVVRAVPWGPAIGWLAREGGRAENVKYTDLCVLWAPRIFPSKRTRRIATLS
jgi:uncharacterized protein YbaR (Trm112 family)